MLCLRKALRLMHFGDFKKLWMYWITHYPGHWSWGRLLVTLIENEQIPREPEEIIQIISSLRSRVLLQEATWTDLERTTEKEKQEKIITIAAESELPAKIKDTAVQNITKALSI